VADALDLLLGLVLEDGRRWGDAASEWQRSDAEAILDLSGPRLHYLTRPRGASKDGGSADTYPSLQERTSGRRARGPIVAALRDRS
jgi:hypothetical protein